VLQWTQANAEQLGVDRERIGVAGISAGAGLAAALALMARDRGQVGLVFQCLLQPMLDDRHGAPTYRHPFAGEFVWTASHNHVGWSALLGCEPGGECVSPYAAAARAESLHGLPPAFIAVGALDLFVEENIEYARRLIRDGVPTELHVHPGACHAFQFLAPDSAVAKSHDSNVIAALRRVMAPHAERMT
jgi:acetyl esterase/lipase